MSAGNPYDPSAVPPGGAGGPNDALAASKVSGPAVGLIVVGVINLLLMLYNVASSAMSLGADPAELQAQLEAQNPELQNIEGFDPQTVTQFMQAGGIVGLIFAVIGIVVAIVIIMGGLKMKNLQSRGLAMTASILAMIPCISCCIIGLPIGIWALVVLNDPNVRASFRS